MLYTCAVCLVTLDDVLATGQPRKLSVVWQCASRLINATKQLHQLGIFYMRWKGILYLRLQIECHNVNCIECINIRRKYAHAESSSAIAE